MEDGEACSEAHSVEDHWLFADEKEGKSSSQQQSFACQTKGAQEELVQSVVCV